MAQATFFKTFTNSDRTSTKTLLHEAIPLTGSIVSGTYNIDSSTSREKNIKTYSHGMFQSVYDYPYLSSSANHIFDITAGCSVSSSLSASSVTQIGKKINVYNQMAQVLMGYDLNGNIRPFDGDGNLSTGGDKIHDAWFLNFSRLLVKDEIKKGSFRLTLGVSGHRTASTKQLMITDASGSSNYFTNCPAGEYGVLYASNHVGTAMSASHSGGPTERGNSRYCGLLFYQAGIAVLTASLFQSGTLTHQPASLLSSSHGSPVMYGVAGANARRYRQLFTGSTIDIMADGIRDKLVNISFNNTTELNSTVYFCRAHHNEFNYSSNPTYLSGSKIRVKGNDVLQPPRSYITTIGLYSSDNELLAVAKLSEPLRKDPTNEVTLRVRLDY